MKEILVETENMKVLVKSEGQGAEVFSEGPQKITEVYSDVEQKIFLENPQNILIHDQVYQ